jgi:hypothetical protein
MPSLKGEKRTIMRTGREIHLRADFMGATKCIVKRNRRNAVRPCADEHRLPLWFVEAMSSRIGKK